MKTKLIVASVLLMGALSSNAQLSVETLGVIKQSGFLQGSANYGAGATLGYAFNEHVKFNVRALAYEADNNWRGGVVDEGGLGIEAKLFSSANGKIHLSAIGGVNHDFEGDDWGMELGVKPSFTVYKQLYIFGQLSYQIWDKQESTTLSGVGLGLFF